MVSMLAGKPDPSFSLVSFSMKVRSPSPQIDNSSTELSSLDGEDISTALWYGPTAGTEELPQWLTGLTYHSHSCLSDEGWRVTVGAGSQDLLYRTFSALVEPEDSILVESPCCSSIIISRDPLTLLSCLLSGVLPVMQALGCKIIEIPLDADGIDPLAIASAFEKRPKDSPT
ncbi:hypothetical protein D9757_007059 [Collybiopsis confluens]|uniref:Uncharacterized protein n=1 Tax=Collybiopsis confluens TaxID=2823264 RepID=A0A8H5HCI2_9AGAR|nr:hypothetical protein D9757_007059 [Collybiopsis confluens]